MDAVMKSMWCGAIIPVLSGVLPFPVSGQGPPAVSPYRLPVIALAQPATGSALPQDKPVVLFRFAAGEATDPIDLGSFAVSVDGENRTSLFQMSGAEAWGPLSSGADRITLGEHEVVARICSARGACSTTIALVTVGPAGPDGAHKPQKKKLQFIEALLSALRTLLKS
jgi:hypothetical protein